MNETKASDESLSVRLQLRAVMIQEAVKLLTAGALPDDLRQAVTKLKWAYEGVV